MRRILARPRAAVSIASASRHVSGPPACIAVLMLVALIGAGCDRAHTAHAARQQAALDRELQRLEVARAADVPEAVEIHAAAIIDRFPATPEAAMLRVQWPALQAAAERHRAQRRRAERWHYNAAEHSQGLELMAELPSNEQDNLPPLRLVLRRHPRWGQSAYLLIARDADFACEHSCMLQMRFDDAPAGPVAVRRALDNVPPALFLRDDDAFYAALETTGYLHIEVGLASGAQATYVFDVGGFQPAKMQASNWRSTPAPAASSPDSP
jgi:hypothetical protein